MTVDDFGVLRNDCGDKVAVFRDVELARKLVRAANLLSDDEGAAIIKANQSGQGAVRMRRVHLWELME